MNPNTGCQRARSRAGDKSGFTLVELMIATFLLAVGILGTAQMLIVADRHVMNSALETNATSLAREIQEKIMSETFDTVYSVFDDTDTSAPETVRDPASVWAAHVNDRLPFGKGEIQVTTPALDAALPYGTVAIEITMSWYEGKSLVTLPFRFTLAKIGA